MAFATELFPGWLVAIAWPLVALLLLGALLRAPWRALRNPLALHLLLATTLILLLLWRLRADATVGLELHFLGVTAATLLLGWPLALVALTAVVGGLVLNGSVPWASAALQLLILGAVPVALTRLMLWLSQRHLPANLFIYVLLNGFLCGGLAVGAAIVSLAGALALGGAAGWQQITYEYLLFLPLMMLPEGLLNGFVVTVLAVNRPAWLATFDARRYFGTS